MEMNLLESDICFLDLQKNEKNLASGCSIIRNGDERRLVEMTI